MDFFEDGPFNAPNVEEKVLKFWDDNAIFEKSLEKTKSGVPFTFYDGPPFATGLPHYGHILASTIKDVIPRYQTMRGRFVRRRWGWDCHGLPIEEIVERKLGISGKKQIEEIGVKTFNETCRSTVLQYVEEWGKMVHRIARWVEFDDSYKTMDRTYMESVWWAFKFIYDKGLIYEGRKVLMYCPRCETPVSNFEVAMDNSYKDVTEEAVTVKFKLTDRPDTFILAWTTTPWTLPGNVALAVGNDIDYVEAKVGDDTYIVAKEKIAVLGAEAAPKKQIKGSELVGLQYEPLFNVPAVASEKSFKVYAADFVNTEDGTGIVHTAVVYGEDDYALGIREGLPVVPLLDGKGKFNDEAPENLRGQYFKDAERFIKKDLETRGLMFKREQHLHSYPHCWRCGTMLYYNAIPAWFVNIQQIKKDLLASNEKDVNWFPDHLKHGRYQKSVESAPDWNISRNRYWGNPIPVWKCDDCGKPTVAGSLEDIVSKSVPPANKYWAIRHGEAEGNVKDIIDSGQHEFHLTDRGREQVAASAESLKSAKIDMIFSSDILRTKETAEMVAKTLGISEVIFDVRLREINLGVLTGKHGADYLAAIPTYKERFAKAPEGGESLNDVRTRAWNFLREIEEKYQGKNILMVSHEDTIWMIRESAEGETDAQAIGRRNAGNGVSIETGEACEVAFKNIPRNDSGAADLHRPYIDSVVLKCDHCGGAARKINEIFDSWVEAGSMPFAEYHYPFENKETFESRFPAQFVAEYIAQTRAWFYVMHVIGVIIFGKAPFENVVTTGNILAEDGAKMSKSKNNFPDPWLVINKYGVDSLRFYLMNSVVMQADNMNFNLRDLETVHRKVTMIFANVYNYFTTYATEKGWKATDSDSTLLAMTPLDRWIRARTKELVNDVTKHLDAYDTVHATRAIEDYMDDLSTWYLRRSRGREDTAFFATFYKVLITVSKVMAPFMPHLTEAVYGGIMGRFGEEPHAVSAESVHLTDWPTSEEMTEEEKAMLEAMAAVREAASVGQAVRQQTKLAVRQPLARMNVILKESSSKLDENLISILLAELNVKAFDESLMAGEGVGTAVGTKRVAEVHIDTVMNEELELEGAARVMERFVQELRKKEGLNVGETITLKYETESETLKKALKLFDTKKTYVSGLVEESGLTEILEVGKDTVKFGIQR
jgi:isoleucyl-tRNA synthetase